MEKNNIPLQIIHTLGFVLTANVLWLMIYYIARGAIYLLDLLRGLDSIILQGLIIELWIPGFAMYLSLQVCKSEFTNSLVKLGLVFSIILFFILYFYFGNYIKPIYDGIDTFETFFKIGFVISIIIGYSYHFLKLIDTTKKPS